MIRWREKFGRELTHRRTQLRFHQRRVSGGKLPAIQGQEFSERFCANTPYLLMTKAWTFRPGCAHGAATWLYALEGHQRAAWSCPFTTDLALLTGPFHVSWSTPCSPRARQVSYLEIEAAQGHDASAIRFPAMAGHCTALHEPYRGGRHDYGRGSENHQNGSSRQPPAGFSAVAGRRTAGPTCSISARWDRATAWKSIQRNNPTPVSENGVQCDSSRTWITA